MTIKDDKLKKTSKVISSKWGTAIVTWAKGLGVLNLIKEIKKNSIYKS